jgi:hypothetical protein
MTKIIAAVALAASSIASAQNVVATSGDPAPASPRAIASQDSLLASSTTGDAAQPLDARLGFLLGGSDVGDALGFSLGVSGGIGYRVGDITARALLDYYRVGDDGDVPRHGRATRVGGAVRYSFVNNGTSSDLQLDFWGELGGGWEHVAWLRGGIIDRPSVEAAVGYDVGGRGARDPSGRRREIGYFMAFRTLIGEGPEMAGVMATCSGPCTQATTPPRTDVTMFFELGLQWGR